MAIESYDDCVDAGKSKEYCRGMYPLTAPEKDKEKSGNGNGNGSSGVNLGGVMSTEEIQQRAEEKYGNGGTEEEEEDTTTTSTATVDSDDEPQTAIGRALARKEPGEEVNLEQEQLAAQQRRQMTEEERESARETAEKYGRTEEEEEKLMSVVTAEAGEVGETQRNEKDVEVQSGEYDNKYQRILDQQGKVAARQAFVNDHSSGLGDNMKDPGYCQAVNSQDPVCDSATAFCNSPLAGQPGSANFVKSCWQEPGTLNKLNPGLNTIALEWANGIPLTDGQRNDLDKLFRITRTRGQSTIKGFTLAPFIQRKLRRSSNADLEQEAKNFIKEEGVFDKKMFQGYLKYKYIKEQVEQGNEQQVLDEVRIPGGITPLERVIKGEKDWDHLKAALLHPGGIYERANIVPTNIRPFSGAHQHHEMTGKGIDPFDIIEFKRNLEDRGVGIPNSKEGLWKLGKKFDALRENDIGAEDFEDMLQRELGDDALRSYYNFKEAVSEKYGFSSADIGRIASGASESIQDIASISPREQHGLGEKEDQPTTTGGGFSYEGQGVSDGGGGLFGGLFGGGEEETATGTGTETGTGGFEPQEVAGATGDQPGIGYQIQSMIEENPLILAGGAGALIWYFTR